MGLIFLIVIGGILGWLAAIVLHQETREGLLRNMGAGIGGALVAGLLISPLIGNGSLLAETYSVPALLISLLGSLLVIASANLLRRAPVR